MDIVAIPIRLIKHEIKFIGAGGIFINNQHIKGTNTTFADVIIALFDGVEY